MGRPRYQRPSIQRTAPKHGRARWYIRVMVDVLADRGRTARREKTLYLGFCDEMGKREAEKLAAEQLKTVNNTPLVIQSQVLFKDLVDVYRSTYLPGLKPATCVNYANRLDKHLLPTFGTLRLFEIDAIKVQQWVYKMENAGLARATRATNLAILRSVFEAAEEWGYFVGRNPGKNKLLGSGGPVRDLRALDPAEALRLLQILRDVQPLGVIVEVALFTGLRIGEILGLTWGAVDPGRAALSVRQGRSQQGELAEPKSPKGRRRVDLGTLTTKVIRPAGAKDADLIWPDKLYGALQSQLIIRAKKVGIQFAGFGFHTLRRTHATWRDQLGLTTQPDADLVRDMGHAHGTMTAHYIQAERSGVVERLQNLVYFSGVSRDSRSVS